MLFHGMDCLFLLEECHLGNETQSLMALNQGQGTVAMEPIEKMITRYLHQLSNQIHKK